MLTSNLKRARDPGNVLLKASATGLDAESVANVSQIFTIGRSELTERIGRLSPAQVATLLRGVDLVLGR
ncbi:MAG: type II toxin-antitoxin system PemK/MazF family toxin [Candidatus Sericytochromatia bacterium]|nr:type II toxin-antitoxin system PemK/MazF family toxin [Candidatus Tanganyikabacteria bacterium]